MTLKTTQALLDTLIDGGELERYDPELGHGDSLERLLYLRPKAIEWSNSILPELKPFYEDSTDPIQQLDSAFRDFCRGEVMWKRGDRSNMDLFRIMRPVAKHIYEIRTSDIRAFGWFISESLFICSSIDDATKVKQYDLYEGYVNQTAADRDKLQLPSISVG